MSDFRLYDAVTLIEPRGGFEAGAYDAIIALHGTAAEVEILDERSGATLGVVEPDLGALGKANQSFGHFVAHNDAEHGPDPVRDAQREALRRNFELAQAAFAAGDREALEEIAAGPAKLRAQQAAARHQERDQ